GATREEPFVAYWLGTLAPDRFHSLILGAQPEPSNLGILARTQIEALTIGGMAAYVGLMEARVGTLPAKARTSWLANDPLAVAAIERARGTETGPRIDPSTALLYCGDQDGPHGRMKELARAMPNATFVSLSGLNHAQSFGRYGVELILAHVRAILAGLT